MKQSKLKVAITGGIGSGKSTACRFIKEEGYPVFSCDETYAKLFDSGVFTDEIVNEFGSDILDSLGRLSRSKLSEKVFCNDDNLQRLNKITHPKIFERMFLAAENFENDICFFEVPLLFEGGYEKLFDKVIVILRSDEARIESVMTRDNKSRDEVLLRINKQYNYKNNTFTQYYVTHNDGNLDKFHDSIKEILLKITKS